MNADDETNITDIELLPDGRICVFGTSLEVLDVLDRLQGGQDTAVKRRLHALEDLSRQPIQRESIQSRGHHG